jgi:uncharacterized MAPEG superfamily protein
MKKEQKIVAAGASSGILAMVAMLVLLTAVTPALPVVADAGERLAFAAKWIALAAVPLILAIGAVGNARFGSEAIDPTAKLESRETIIDGRVADNTTQQFLLFGAASLAVAAASRGDQLGLLSAAAIVFVICRIAFWVGYRIHPLYRAFGFSSTFYLNIVLLGTALWRTWS